MASQHDYNEIYQSLCAIVQPDTVFELRLLGANKRRIDGGYFDSPAQAANALVSLEGYYAGIYVTPNPLKRDVLARSANRITPWIDTTTSDGEVEQRKWLLVDIDPVRPVGISSTDEEHKAAIAKGVKIAGMLSIIYGWCKPLLASSGNGCHLMYPMNEPNTQEIRDDIATFLKCLAAKYNDEATQVDTVNFNAARIWRVYGTWARKGDSIAERPHRKSAILAPLTHLNVVNHEQIAHFNTLNRHLIGQQTQSAAAGVSKYKLEYPEDEKVYKSLNDHAMRRIPEWVPIFFPTARPYKEGFRVASADLGLDFEEDLTIHPWPLGIKYFGVSDQGDTTEGRRTPVALVAEFAADNDKAQAARLLADVLKAPVSEFSALPPPMPATVAAAANAGVGGMEALLGPKPSYNFMSIRSVADLQRREFRKQTWVVNGVIPTGNVMLAARPKMRKTWLALQLALAVSTGRKWLGYDTTKGDVLALLLEDNERRLQERIRILQTFDLTPPDLSGFKYWTGGMDYDGTGKLKVMNPDEAAATMSAFPRGQAGVDAIEAYLEQFPATRMVIIDTFAHFRDNSSGSRDVYQRDYDSMVPLTKLAARKNVLIVPVHHEKKGLANSTSGDFMEDVNGSSGITGGLDGVMSIKGRRGVQDENESRKLYISGRDIPTDYEIDISFDAATGGWKTAARQDVRLAIRELLARHPYINQVEMAGLLPNVSRARLTKVLMDMKLEQEIEQGRFGYSLKRA